MKIEKYSFGEMIIDGQTFTADLKIIKAHVMSGWWREQGHSLSLTDIEDVLKQNPLAFIIGCGYSGTLKVPPALKKSLNDRGIDLVDVTTQEAVAIFNSTDDLLRTAFGFHLTC